MPLTFIDELETKIDTLINSLNKTRNESEEIKSRVQELEKENDTLKSDLETVNANSSENRGQLDTAAEKIKNLITRLESVE